MRKKDLKTTLGTIRARDELVSATMMRINGYKARENEKQERSYGIFSPALRIACAACAFLLVVGIGIYSIGQGDEPMPILNNDKGISDTDGEDVTTHMVSEGTIIDTLTKQATNIDGNWVIVKGSAVGCASLGIENNGEREHWQATISTSEILKLSDSFEFASEEFETHIFFDNAEDRDDFVNTFSDERYYLISVRTVDGNIVLTSEQNILIK